MHTLRGAIVGTIALLITSTTVVGTVHAAAAAPPSAPYTAFTTHFAGLGYIDGSFSYEASRNTLNVYQQNANGYALVMSGSQAGHSHGLNVTPPTGTRFTAGTTYPTTKSFSPSPTTTVFNIRGDGRECDWSSTPGTLTVTEAAYDDANGQFTAFAASYSVPCGGSGFAKGEIRFQSSIGYKATDSLDYRLQFGQQPVGVAGTPKDFTVGVYGTLSTTFGAATLSGTDPAAFEISSNTCSGNTLSYGETCTLRVTPKASAIREQIASLTLVDDTIGGKVVRLLSLDGFDPRDATASPSHFNFGLIPAYDTSAPQTVTLTGSGSLPITFGQGAITGQDPSKFQITNDTCSLQTLANGQNCTITAIARPTSGTEARATVSLPDNSVAGSTQIGLYVNSFNSDRGTYYPMSPYRIMDTRSGTGAPQAKIPAGGTVHLQVTGSGGVPTDASTVVLNVTATGSTGSGYISVYPTGVPRPNVSSLNFSPGWTGANSVTVQVGANGQVDLFNGGVAVHAIVDVSGYYSKGRSASTGYMGGQYHPLSSPVRLVDTRDWGIGRIPGNAYINAAASWNSAINPRVRAFAVNITATQPAGGGYLTAWNGYEFGLPNTSTLNYTANATVSNFAVVPSAPCDDCGSATGWPSIGVYTNVATHIIVDIVGFYDDASLPDGLRFEPIVPTRIADTRVGQGWPSRLGPSVTATITAPGTIVGADTWALATNVTAVQPSHYTFLTVWPAGITGVERPNVSNLNPSAGVTVPNAVQTMIGPDYGFNVYNNVGTCDVIVDVVGTFYEYPPSAPPGWPGGSRSPSGLGTPQVKSGLDSTSVTPTAATPALIKRL